MLIHVLFLVLLIGTELFFLGLDVVNLNHAEGEIEDNRDELVETFGVEDPERLKRYNRLKTGFSRLKSVIGLVVLLLVLYSGLLEQFVGFFQSLAFHPIYSGVGFFLTMSVLVFLFGLPFSFFKTFVVEEIFDFNESTPGLWVTDQLKSLGLTIVFVALLSGVLLWFIETFSTTWWLWGWGFFVLFGLAMQIIYPRVIAPLFNDFTPVEEGDLRKAIEEVFDRAGFTCSQIFTMDASRRSGHSNAYFIGFGRTKRVVLFDTLIDQLGLDEVQGVLAHELAHWKKGHVWKGVFRSAVRTGLMLGALYYLVEARWLYEMFGIDGQPFYAGLLLGGLWLGPISKWLSPLENGLSIRDEREADEFAVDVMEEGEPLIEALRGLVSENLGNPYPHPVYATFHYSHPPIPDRIRYIRQQETAEA